MGFECFHWWMEITVEFLLAAVIVLAVLPHVVYLIARSATMGRISAYKDFINQNRRSNHGKEEEKET